jgi:hypothetical protein
MQRRDSVRVRVSACVLAVLAVMVTGCSKPEDTTPPVGTIQVSLSRPKVALGSPVEVTYRFTLAKDAPNLGARRVFVHFLDADEELMWTDDHEPPTPTSDWKPGQTIEYTRSMFIPSYPYVGAAKVAVGMYSPATNERLKFSNDDRGDRSYKVVDFELLPQTENIFVMFKDGWHPAETPPDNAAVEWQWTKKDATLSVRNPKKDVTLYLHVDHPGVFSEPQTVTVTLGDKTVDSFTIQPKQELIRKPTITAAQLGTADVVDIKISVDKTYIPAVVTGGANRDPRELGVRVFHAYVQPTS